MEFLNAIGGKALALLGQALQKEPVLPAKQVPAWFLKIPANRVK